MNYVILLHWHAAALMCGCRYRGEKESNDVGVTVNETDDSFAHWARLWDLYHSKQLITTFKALMHRCGLKVPVPLPPLNVSTVS